MSYTAAPKTIRIELPSNKEYWVEARAVFRYGELKDYSQYGGDPENNLTTAELLRISILTWNLDDDAGSVLQITPENIDHLLEEDAIAIADKINAVKDGDSNEKKNSANTSEATTKEQ